MWNDGLESAEVAMREALNENRRRSSQFLIANFRDRTSRKTSQLAAVPLTTLGIFLQDARSHNSLLA